MKKRTNIYFTQEQWQRLTRLSKETLATPSAMIRRAVDEYLDRQEKKRQKA